MARYPDSTMYAILLRIAIVVLINEFANDIIEHTDPLPLFDIRDDIIISAVANDLLEGRDLPDSEDEVETQFSRGGD